MQKIYLIVVLFAFAVFPANATMLKPKERGINHVTVSKSAKESESTKNAQDRKGKGVSNQEEPVKTPITTLAQLEDWPYLNDLLSRREKGVESALDAIERDPSVVPPTALFYAAESLADQNRMERAATYYYLGQLRARFDFMRWGSPADSQNRPEARLTGLSMLVGQKVSPWVLSDTNRTAGTFQSVKELDLKTPYSYLPAYPLPENITEEDEWADLLTQAREEYFAQSQKIMDALKSVK